MAGFETTCSSAVRRRWKASALVCGAALLFAPVVAGSQVATSENDKGRQLFTEVAKPPCGLCHTLADAGATGKIGPSLDELKPDVDRVVRALKQGVGVMPAFEESLTEEQIAALARYVARVTGGAK